MTDELMERLRSCSSDESMWSREAADRIEQLTAERDAAYANGYTDAETEISKSALGQKNDFLHFQYANAADRIENLQAQNLRLSGMVHDLKKEIAISDALLISEGEASLARLARAEKAEAERDKAFKAHLLLRSYASHDDSCKINLYSEKPVCSCGLNSAWYAIDHQKRT